MRQIRGDVVRGGYEGEGMTEERKYSSFRRPFRLQLTASSVVGFDGPASRGRCQFPGCRLFEWSNGVEYCREHWLLVHHCERLPERYGKP